MARQKRPGIFDAEIPLEQRLEEIAALPEHAEEKTKGHGHPGRTVQNQGKDQRRQDRGDQAADRALDRLMGADGRGQVMAAEEQPPKKAKLSLAQVTTVRRKK